MLCQRCGLTTFENGNICTSCRLVYPVKSASAKRVAKKLYDFKRALIYIVAFIVCAVALGYAGLSFIGLKKTAIGLLAIGGGVAGILVLYAARRIAGIMYKAKLSSSTRKLNDILNKATKKYGPDRNNSPKDADSTALHGLALVMKGNYESGLNELSKAVSKGTSSLEVYNNLGAALALNGDINGAMLNWQNHSNNSHEYIPAKFNTAVASFIKRDYKSALQIFSEIENIKDDKVASLVPLYMGLLLYKTGQTAEAYVKFEEAVSYNPFSGDIQNNMGICLYLLGDEAGGISKLNAARRVEPGHALSCCNLGRIYLHKGALEKALQLAQFAVWLNSNNPYVRATHALVVYALGDIDLALSELEHLSTQVETTYELHYHLGRLYIDKNEVDRGIEHLKSALKLEPEAVEVMSHLGAILQIKRRFSESRKMNLAVLEKEPNNVRTSLNLALNYMDDNEPVEALAVLKKVYDITHDLPELYLITGVALEMEGNLIEAITYYLKTLELDNKNIIAKFNLSLCYLTEESTPHAVIELEELIQMQSNFGLAYLMLGCAFERKGNLGAALKNWEVARKYDVKSADLYANLGIAYYTRDKVDLAVSNLQHVLRLRDGSAGDYNNLALAYCKAKNIPEAIKAFTKSLLIEPHNPVTHSNLGLAYYFNNDVEKATYEWATVGVLDPQYASKRRNIESATYDDTQAAFPAINFQLYTLRPTPGYSAPPLKLIPSSDPEPWIFDTQDADLATVPELKHKIKRLRKATRLYRVHK